MNKTCHFFVTEIDINFCVNTLIFFYILVMQNSLIIYLFLTFFFKIFFNIE